MKPKDVSDRAWEFAREATPAQAWASAVHLQNVLESVARAFDAATKDLREVADSLAACVEYEAGVTHDERALLASYTPGDES